MKLKAKDELISMDILPSQIVAKISAASDTPEDESGDEEELMTEEAIIGPWVLVISTGGYGKRVPVTQFRLQNRTGMGVRSMKFRSPQHQLAALHVVNQSDELMIVTERGIIIRQAVDAISPQSRMATGVRVQRLDADDAIAAVALVPPLAEGEEDEEE